MVPPLLEISQLSKFTLADVQLDVWRGEIVTLLGKSGSGKSTLLRCICGIERPDSGLIRLDGEEIEGPNRFLPPEHRGVGLVFQNFALFPHLTVEENIRFGLKQLPAGEQQRILRQQMALQQIEGLEKRYPHQISGGQQQRVAVARALAPSPRLLLLDEPFSNLDEQVRHDLRIELRELFKAQGITAIIVSHASNDAVTTSDRIAFLDGGQIQQLAPPVDAYDQPSTPFVASYLGRANLVTARQREGRWTTILGEVPIDDPSSEPAEGVLCIRPEWIGLERAPETGDATIQRIETIGPQHFATIRMESEDFLVNLAFDRSWQPGERVRVHLALPRPLRCLRKT